MLEEDFEQSGRSLILCDCGKKEIATHAYKQGTGARGLCTIMEAVLREDNFLQTPEVTVDAAYVKRKLS
jgi:ATP-dependent protease Clp ATPase subunit